MNDTIMTIVGNVVDQPRTRQTKSGHAVSNFRVASTSRRFDREQQRYVDNATLFVNVTCWRAMGENVDQSLKKGQPVVVYGRFYTRDYVVNEQMRTSYELEAMAVGHDLSRGVSTFERVFRAAPTVTVTLDSDGVPIDDSDHWLDLAAPSDDEGRGALAGPDQAEQDADSATSPQGAGVADRSFATAS